MRETSPPRSTLCAITALLCLGALAVPAAAGSRTMTVFGATHAERCYQAATNPVSSITAIDSCDQAIEEEPLSETDRAATYVNRGILQARNRHLEKAVRDYSRALEMNPALVRALINRANALMRMKRYDDALADYDKALFYSQGRDPLVFYNRSLTYEKLGRKADAREDLVRALQLQPDSRRIRDALGSLE